MPEQSEWLLAGGAAKRNPRYHATHRYASERRENRLPRRQHSRPPDAFLGDDGFPGVALKLNPRLRALGLSPSAYNLFRFERIVLWVVVFGEIIDIFALLLLAWVGGL